MIRATYVHMTMFDLLWCSLTHIDYLNFEVERFSCQGMIAIDGDVVAFHFSDTHLSLCAAIALGDECHAYLDGVDALEYALADDLDEVWIVFPISLIRRDCCTECCTGSLAGEFCLQAWDKVIRAM